MKKFTYSTTIIIASFAFVLAGPLSALAATAPNLGVAAGYSVFGNAGITETIAQLSHLWGNAGGNGLGNASLIASQVDGSIDAAANVPVVNAIAAAYGALSQPLTGAIDLAASPTVVPGVYDVAATAFNSPLTLNGAGVYIFRSTSSIAQTAGGTMILTGGATACNVFWQIPTSMTFAAIGNIEGTIITNTGLISFVSGIPLKGRAWAATQVTMDNNQITEPTCVGAPGGGSSGAHYFAQLPAIDVTKTPSPLSLPGGAGPVTYTYIVKNIGKVAMNTVWVKDNKCAPVTYVSGDTNSDGLLDLSETWTYTCAKTVSQTETNTATAHGYGVGLGMDVYATANAIVVVSQSVVPPLIHVVKMPNVSVLQTGGGPVVYTYLVTNPGITPLHDVSITDNKCTGLPGRVVGNPGDLNKDNLLDPGEIWQFTCKSNITQTTTNLATAEGTANGLIAIAFANATVIVTTGQVLGASIGFPNTGLPPRGESSPWNVLITVGILVLVTAGAVVLYKRTV